MVLLLMFFNGGNSAVGTKGKRKVTAGKQEKPFSFFVRKKESRSDSGRCNSY